MGSNDNNLPQRGHNTVSSVYTYVREGLSRRILAINLADVMKDIPYVPLF